MVLWHPLVFKNDIAMVTHSGTKWTKSQTKKFSVKKVVVKNRQISLLLHLIQLSQDKI